MDNRKYIILTFLSGAALLGMSIRGLGGPLLARFEIGDPMVLGLLNATSLAGLVVGIVTFLVLNRHPLAYSFTDESITELRKVTWPDREETVRSTMIVLGCTFALAFSLAFYDFVWAKITGIFLFTGA